MKLFIQIPCLNEEATLARVIRSVPKCIEGISEIQFVVIDDGSTDRTGEVATAEGVQHVVRHARTLGLAFTFRHGLDTCITHGADIIVNMDGDHQYRGEDIPILIAPILAGKADLVIGDRQTQTNPEFSALKKLLQRVGSASVRYLSGSHVSDAVSGFRALNREAALKLTILSNYSYTIESILQAHAKGLTISEVKITTNPKTRESRLMRSMFSYLKFSLATIVRVFTMYNPLKVFLTVGAILLLAGTFLTGRFLFFYFTDGGAGKVQSLIIASVLLMSGVTTIAVGLLADLTQFNRRLLEDILERVKRSTSGHEK